MALEPGDEVRFDGAVGEVVALTATTDGEGRGLVEYGGATFRFRVLKALGPAEPLVTANDPHFRVGLVKRQGEDLFCLVADDLPAPGWGRWIQQDRWREAHELSGQDAVVFVLGWRPGRLTVKKGGQAQAGVFVDLTLDYETSQGPHRAWWQPAYPYNDLTLNDEGVPVRGPNRLGSFKTDPEGVVCHCLPDGTLEPILLPRGFGAVGHREQDAWPGKPEPERVLTGVRLWYLQESVEVREGEAATLDAAAVSLQITGPAWSRVKGYCEDGYERFNVSWGMTGGTTTVTGLPPGKYKLRCLPTSGVWAGWGYQPHRELDCPTPGGSYSITFGTGTPAPTGTLQGIAYAYGCEPLAGAELWLYGQKVNPSPPPPALPPGWYRLGTTGTDGGFSFDLSSYAIVSAVVITHPDWGSQYTTATGAFCPVLGGHLTGIRSMGAPPLFHEGVWPWGTAGPHENLGWAGRIGTLKQRNATTGELTGREWPLMQAPSGFGVAGGPVPRYAPYTLPPGAPSPGNPPTAWVYDVCDPDGTVVTTAAPQPDGGALWCDPIGNYPWWRDTQGQAIFAVMGGKIEGNVVEAARGSLITGDNLPEAARMGLEFGRRRQPLEARAASETADPEDRSITFQSWECPYCGGPVRTDPDRGGYRRGTCMQCANFGVTTDARTYCMTPTLAAADDWRLRWVRTGTGGGYSDRLVEGWPRPEEYDETDAYLVEDWLGLGLPRWVARHLVLGTWEAGLFVKGESIAEAEARLGRTVGPVRLKLELTDDTAGSGQTLRIAATRADNGRTEWLPVRVPAGSRRGDRFPLRWAPHHQYPQGYYTEVTAIEPVSGDGAVRGQIVNDGPAWHSSVGVRVAHQAHSPYACEVALGRRDPHLVEDFAGRVHLVYLRDGQVLHRTLEGTSSAWSRPENVSLQAGWPGPCTDPSVVALPHGEETVAADCRGTTRLGRYGK